MDKTAPSGEKQALFPLSTVVFPGSLLPLQIFEQRYLSLVRDCMRRQTGFVCVLIEQGREVGDRPQIFRTGCYVDIVDWDSLPGNMLGIRVEGRYRVELGQSTVRDDGLLLAQARAIAGFDASLPLPPQARDLADTLRLLLQHPFASHYQQRVDFNSASDIAWRLSELLPVDSRQKQQLLESASLAHLLDQLAIHLNRLQS